MGFAIHHHESATGVHGRPGVLWFMGSQRVGHDWAPELNWTCGSDGTKSADNDGEQCLIPGLGIYLQKGMASHPVFLPGEFHGQRNLEDYSPWGLKELDMTESLILHLQGFPGGASGKESPCQYRRCRFNPWIVEIVWRGHGHPTPRPPLQYFDWRIPWTKEPGGLQWNCKELDTTETTVWTQALLFRQCLRSGNSNMNHTFTCQMAQS